MLRILVVDDEPIQLANLQFALGRAGYSVQTAGTFDQALDIAAWFRPHILVTDWMLDHKRDGGMLSQRLRQSDPSLKTIVITAYPKYELEGRFDDWSRDPVIEKPFSLGELVESVHLLASEWSERPERIPAKLPEGSFICALI